MNVAGSAGREPKSVAHFNDIAVEIAELLVVLRHAVAHHELIVAYGLNLKIVVELSKIVDVVLIADIQHSLEYLASLAGASVDKSLTVLDKSRLRYKGLFIEEFKVAKGYKSVEILQTCLIADKYDKMVAFQLLCLYLVHKDIELLYGLEASFAFQSADKLNVYLCQHESVVGGSVVVEFSKFKLFCHKVQLVTSHFGEHGLTHDKRVYPCVFKINALPFADLIYHVCIVTGVVSHKNGLVSAELHEHTERLCFVGSICNIGVAYACELRYPLGDMESRIHLGIEAVHYL